MFSLQNLHHSAHYCKTLLYLLVDADSDLLTGSGSDFKYIIVRTKEKKIPIGGKIAFKKKIRMNDVFSPFTVPEIIREISVFKNHFFFYLLENREICHQF